MSRKHFSRLFSRYDQTGLNGYVYDFSADYDAIVGHDILDIHNYLMKKNNIKCLLFYSNYVSWLQCIKCKSINMSL